MKKSLLILSLGLINLGASAQAILTKWTKNTTGYYASYWENTNGSPTSPSYVFYNTTDSADVQRVCYSNDSIWITSKGMTQNMGKFLNPGAPSAQTFVYSFPRTTSVPSTKTVAPASFAIGALLNGVPIYGRGAGTSWTGSANAGGGPGIWNTEVYKAEGFVLDTAYGAHPQQQGQYHSHATPKRYYGTTSTSVHSPLVGFAFDGYPIYGPYGYSTAMSSGSAVTRMKSGYSLRNITTRTTLPGGATASQSGPPVNTTYPIGTYCEDYEWLATNGGDLDQYNGRFCVTPDYPSGTYAYFVTMTSAGIPQYPYYIGPYYYGNPNDGNFNSGCLTATVPSTGVSCATVTGLGNFEIAEKFKVYPNPTNTGDFNLLVNSEFIFNDYTAIIYNALGEKIGVQKLNSDINKITILSNTNAGIYFIHVINDAGETIGKQSIIKE